MWRVVGCPGESSQISFALCNFFSSSLLSINVMSSNIFILSTCIFLKSHNSFSRNSIRSSLNSWGRPTKTAAFNINTINKKIKIPTIYCTQICATRYCQRHGIPTYRSTCQLTFIGKIYIGYEKFIFIQNFNHFTSIPFGFKFSDAIFFKSKNKICMVNNFVLWC